jgi:TfoX/Sxy family transcriptional regulator of competence genes
MSFSDNLYDRIRKALSHLKNVEEKHMIGGNCFMVNGKMCVGVAKDALMCRVGPENYEQSLRQKGCCKMVFAGKPLKGYVLVNEEGTKSKKDFDRWIKLCLDFNARTIAKKAKS